MMYLLLALCLFGGSFLFVLVWAMCKIAAQTDMEMMDGEYLGS
jgi:hypothetical protein